MREYLAPLGHFQILFLPAVIVLLAWAVWRTVRHKDMAVGLALYLGLVVVCDGFYNTGIFIPGFAKGSIRYSEVCALLLFLNLPDAGQYRQWRRTVLFFAGLYFALLFLSALRADPILSGIFGFRRLIIPQIVALVVSRRGFSRSEDYRRFFVCLTALILIIGLFSFWDLFFDRWLLHSDMLFKPEYWMNRKHGRFGSIFLNPNYLGAFTVLVFPSIFVWTMNERRPRVKLFGWSGLMALLFCLVETKSRGPLLAFGIVLILLVLGPVGPLSRKRRMGFLALFILVFAIFMPGFYSHSVERFSSLKKATSTRHLSRETTWIYARRIIAGNPLLGVGFGERQFKRAMVRYGFDERFGTGPLDNPHNSYLQIAVYAGIPALLAFLLANGILLLKAAGIIIRRENEADAPTVFGFAVGITGFLACIYPDMHLFTQNVAPVYWTFFGLLVSLATSISTGAAENSLKRVSSGNSMHGE